MIAEQCLVFEEDESCGLTRLTQRKRSEARFIEGGDRFGAIKLVYNFVEITG